MINNNKKNKKGFALLFVVVLSSIILSVALGIADVSFKEVLFSTSTKASNEAFYAADTGVECALYWDLHSGISAFGKNPNIPPYYITQCTNTIIDIYSTSPSPYGTWTFYLPGLGRSGKSCAKVVVTKTQGVPPASDITNILSSGYDIGENLDCSSTSTNRLERQIEVNY